MTVVPTPAIHGSKTEEATPSCGDRYVGKPRHGLASGAGLGGRFHWPSVGTWARHNLHHTVNTFPGATPGSGTIILLTTTQTPEYASSCQWGDIPGIEGSGWGGGGACLQLLQSLYTWLSEISLPCWKSAPGPLRAIAACDRKIVKNRPASLPSLPMNFVYCDLKYIR